MLIEVLKEVLTITSFVFLMMSVIEYVNVQTSGTWHNSLKKHKWQQYFLSAILGIIPGCLGAFTVVALYSHRVLSFGALVAAMIATSGDEAFIMFSMFPLRALFLTLILFIIGITVGFFIDKVLPQGFLFKKISLNKFPIHEEERCNCFIKSEIINQLKHCSFQRALLIGGLLFLFLGFVSGEFGPQSWNWIRITILLAVFVSLFIVTTVPEHFLEEHLWNHIVKIHLPKIFFWTFGAIFVINFILKHLHFESWISDNQITVLIIACLIGLIPESGPHMIFVILFFQGTIPFSILLASSIVQDGHGMLPLLAESKRGFISVKLINLVVGLSVGILGYFTSW